MTASYDLNVDQLLDLLDATPPSWLEVVIHQQIPMFHMEHCVFCAFLSPGTDATNCGRPATITTSSSATGSARSIHSRPTWAAGTPSSTPCPRRRPSTCPGSSLMVPGTLRIEFLDEDAASVERIIGLYRDALAGRRDAKKLWRELKATNQYGVTRGRWRSCKIDATPATAEDSSDRRPLPRSRELENDPRRRLGRGRAAAVKVAAIPASHPERNSSEAGRGTISRVLAKF